MYGEVKNPFGLRNGKYITINDLRGDERGLACDCVCPFCKDPFEARLGSIRIHHFAHSGEGCDEISSYLMGLYGFFRDFILANSLIIPALTIYYRVDGGTYAPVTADNCAKEILFRPRKGEDLKKLSLSREMRLRFDDAKIVTAKSGRPEAVVASFHGKNLAFVIAPPSTVCKDFRARPYKDMATLEIRLVDKADQIGKADTEGMNGLLADPKIYRWLSSPVVTRAFDRINEERTEAYRQYQNELEKRRLLLEKFRRMEAEQRMQEEERRRQERERLHEEQERHRLERRQEAEKKKREQEEREEQRRREAAQREENERRMVAERMKTPGQLVVDTHGNRWIQCETCGKIAMDDAFWRFQWNRGQCNECKRGG